MPRAFVDEQRAYWREVDADHFRWQTGAPYVADTEAALLDAVALPTDGRLLEIGCGEGANLVHLARRAAADGRPVRLYGVDFSVAKAGFAARAASAATACADAARLPFGEGAFDAVLVRDLLHHVADRGAVLAEARRVLRPGGALAVIEPNGWNPMMAAMAAAIPEERGMLRSNAERLRGEVAAAGFIEVTLTRRQPMPVSRLCLHYRLGAPALGRFASVRRALAMLEGAARRLPAGLWAYLVVTGRKQ